MKQITILASLAIVLLTGCGDSLQDNRLILSELPGLYEGGTLPGLQISAAPVNDCQATTSIITSAGEFASFIECDGDGLRLFGLLEAQLGVDFVFENATGTADVWYQPDLSEESDYVPGPHATATILSAELDLDPDEETGKKTIILDIDFEALDGQGSQLADADFDDFDGEYFLEADADYVASYEARSDVARTVGYWENTFEESTDVELLYMYVDEFGNFLGEVAGPPAQFADYCEPGDSIDGFFDVEGSILPYDPIQDKSPAKNAYLISGSGDCDDGDGGSIEFEGIAWLSEDEEVIRGDSQINARVEYLFTKDGEDDALRATRWNMMSGDSFGALSVDADSVNVSEGAVESGELDIDIAYSGDPLEAGFDVLVSFEFKAFSDNEECASTLDTSTRTISCPATSGDCDELVLTYNYNGTESDYACEFSVTADALPAFVDDGEGEGFVGVPF